MTRTEVVVWGIVALALAGTVALAVVARQGRETAGSPVPADASESAGTAPQKTSELLPASPGDFGDVPCVERSGRAMRTGELRGRFVVADFVYTYCSGPCPAMTQSMRLLQDATKGADDLLLATFTVDPDRDTTEVLAQYADHAGADKERWLFLRCERPALQKIAYDHLKLVKDRKDLLAHSAMFVLADREGRVRAYYSPREDTKWLAKLLADLEILRRESPK